MKLVVLGTGCARCKALMQNVEAAVSALQIQADIEKVEAIEEILKYGVMGTPALIVDGKVKAAGRVPSTEEIQKLLG
jgi:small redox-active disulfide protein 2